MLLLEDRIGNVVQCMLRQNVQRYESTCELGGAPKADCPMFPSIVLPNTVTYDTDNTSSNHSYHRAKKYSWEFENLRCRLNNSTRCERAFAALVSTSASLNRTPDTAGF